jgi:GNAT superfamily N-acetyltransferase
VRASSEMRELTIRPFSAEDGKSCLAIFDSNTPAFFSADERNEFAAFLADGRSSYFVATWTGGPPIGCGGYYLNRSEGLAGLCWGMVHRSWHRRGIGSALLNYRLAAIERLRSATVVRVNTAPRTQGFFAEHGFRVVRVVADGFAPGVDRVEMEKQLALTSTVQDDMSSPVPDPR